jgi:hypothetical protein
MPWGDRSGPAGVGQRVGPPASVLVTTDLGPSAARVDEAISAAIEKRCIGTQEELCDADL